MANSSRRIKLPIETDARIMVTPLFDAFKGQLKGYTATMKAQSSLYARKGSVNVNEFLNVLTFSHHTMTGRCSNESVILSCIEIFESTINDS
jgi:hypothetical protein